MSPIPPKDLEKLREMLERYDDEHLVAAINTLSFTKTDDVSFSEKSETVKDPVKIPTPTEENPVIAIHDTAYGELHGIEEKYLIKCGHSFNTTIKAESDHEVANHDCSTGWHQDKADFAKKLKGEGLKALNEKLGRLSDIYQCMPPCKLNVTILGKKGKMGIVDSFVPVQYCTDYNKKVVKGVFTVPVGYGFGSVKVKISCVKS